MASERTVYVKVGAKVDGAVAGLRKVKAGVDDLTKADLQKPRKAFDDLATKGALVGGVVALGIGKAVSSFADFDQAMSGVAANSGAVGAELNALREQAIKLGSDTQFSATEAAQGINELAKAGVSSQEILNGGLKGALDLAAAGQISVAQAAETTASALNQFEQDGSQATHVADLLSNAANAAQGGVGDMGQALAQAGVAAHAAGLDIDETTTLLALFAKAGLLGSDAGTSLKTMMQRLSAPTEKAAATMEELGISAYNAQGQFVGAEELVRQLSESTKNLSTEAKMAAFNTIFGSDAIRAASIAAAAGADGYTKMATEVTKAGGAAANAAKLTDNLKGDIERLGGSIDTAFIQSGSSANGALRTLTQGLGGVIDVVAALPAPLTLAATGLAGLALTVPKGVSLYRDFASSLDTMGLSMEKVSNKAPKLGASLRGLQGVAAGLTIAAIIGGISNSLTDLAAVEFDPQSIKDGTVSLDDFNKKMAETNDLGLPIATTLSDFNQVLEATFNAGKGQEIDNWAAKFNSALGFENTSDIEVARQRFEQLDKALAALTASGQSEAAARMFQEVTAAAAAQGINVDQVRAKLPGYTQAVIDAGNASAAAAPQMGDTSEAVKDIEKKADDAKKALDDLTATLEGFGSPLAAQRAAQRDYADAVTGAKDAIKKQREELIKQRADELASGRASQSSLDSLAKARQRVTQAQEKLNSVEAKGTAAQKLAARQALEKANLAVEQAQGRVDSSSGKVTEADRRAAEKWADAKMRETNLLDLNTEAGRTNQANLDGIRAKTLKAATSTFELTHSMELAAKEVARGRKDFVDQAVALGLTSVQANALADNMGLIPKDVKTAIGLSGVETANAKLDVITGKVTDLDKKTAKPKITPVLNGAQMDVAEVRLNQLARSRTALIVPTFTNVKGVVPGDFIGGRGGVRAATGGAIYGAGTATSDSIPAMLSNGEHVLTAAEVAAAGGHGAIYALRKAILAGGVEYRAQGGPIAAPMSAYRSAPASFSGGSGRIDYARLASAMASAMPPQLSVYSGEDARSASRTAIRDWEWEQTQR